MSAQPIEKKCKFNVLPGSSASKRRGRPSDYGAQLQMKQMIRNYYGMLEKQFRKFYKIADRRKGSTGDNLLTLLESRLDNVVTEWVTHLTEEKHVNWFLMVM